MKPFGSLARILDVTLRGSGGLLGNMFKLSPKTAPINLPLIPHSKVVETVTGMKMGLGGFLAAGNRTFNMERLFNVREGLVEDTLPDRMTKEPQDPDDPRTRVPLDEMLPKFYKARGWDARGVPKPEILRTLGMDFAVKTVRGISQSASALQESFEQTRSAYEKKQAVQIKKRKAENKKRSAGRSGAKD